MTYANIFPTAAEQDISSNHIEYPSSPPPPPVAVDTSSRVEQTQIQIRTPAAVCTANKDKNGHQIAPRKLSLQNSPGLGRKSAKELCSKSAIGAGERVQAVVTVTWRRQDAKSPAAAGAKVAEARRGKKERFGGR